MNERSNWVWEGKPWEAFKSFAIIFSFVLNFTLLIVLLLISPLIVPVILNNTVEPIVGGLNDSFIMMSNATISTTIPLDKDLQLNTTIPLSTTTNVRIIEDVPLSVNATFILPAGGGTINGTVVLALPANTSLPVALNLDVPVNQPVHVSTDVPVQIQLSETDLGVPFTKLQNLFNPLNALVTNLPSSNEELVQRATSATLEPK
ncbi:MAG TPA: hypothetical protein PLD25_20715 [Chloroflexota bacterium]|nr:hypothetical protein [Chloroflexota bacterium]HUM72003.1 hypothetical protein [Chloroflexota bacterium]